MSGARSCSQVCVEELVDISPQRARIDGREISPPLQERCGREPWARHGAELSHAPTGSRDGDQLAARCAVDHLSALVPQISNAHLGHARNCITRETLVRIRH